MKQFQQAMRVGQGTQHRETVKQFQRAMRVGQGTQHRKIYGLQLVANATIA
ncbi:hypothetical protein SS7213T_01858 [Staphylococcus simiae CCM 7213 = CCUG 51256]|uniref:Uncharacterized protein n=1 Tax=Staphylococcus simiae CCM 7213 = CCUG 51256 TaxID=911238 RepID=G5JG07_9STAP|nr:hypothetical protein SS7213T_01858 [Staphylococcus simiae CCM 7213 = CCUG 51256]